MTDRIIPFNITTIDIFSLATYVNCISDTVYNFGLDETIRESSINLMHIEENITVSRHFKNRLPVYDFTTEIINDFERIFNQSLASDLYLDKHPLYKLAMIRNSFNKRSPLSKISWINYFLRFNFNKIRRLLNE